jgi:hypothetical protein
VLVLDDNELGDAGAAHLADLLKVSESCEKVAIRRNGIEWRGRQALGYASIRRGVGEGRLRYISCDQWEVEEGMQRLDLSMKVHTSTMSVLLCTNVRPSLHQCPSFSAPMSVLLCTMSVLLCTSALSIDYAFTLARPANEGTVVYCNEGTVVYCNEGTVVYCNEGTVVYY